MENLSAEQLEKIRANRAAALLKKQQSLQKSKERCDPNNAGSSGTTSGFEKSNTTVGSTLDRNTVTAVCKVIGCGRFLIEVQYNVVYVDIFKTISGRKYETDLKRWSFPLSEQTTLISKLRAASPNLLVSAIPDSITKVLLEPDPPESPPLDWSRIDKTLRDYLLPFQVEGIKFGILKNGRCLIADDMGLGKTIQALGIAHYYKENWPLLIVCPSSMRYPWQDAVNKFLPSVNSIQVLTTARDQVLGHVVVISYDLMKNCFDDLVKRHFGAIIFDESHCLKSSRSIRTATALQLASTAKNVILLSGTPALSRPQELYSQIFMIDPLTFKKFFDFGIRYCDGKKEKFGWNFSGSSNLEELEQYLKKKIMIRRLKSEVIKQLPSKIRKVVILHPKIQDGTNRQIKRLDSNYTNQEGSEKHSTLLSYYSLTGTAKLTAVCEYLEEKLETKTKFLVFAHHNIVMNGICHLLQKKSVDFVRIDGGIGPQLRKDYCDRFQTLESCRVAVLSIKAANCGITLTAAQLVIFAELYWNPGELTQAEDRAHRIGQQDSVLVEYLIAKGTVDEHLWKLVEKKLDVLNKVGLSKDSFKNSDTKHVGELRQAKITSMFKAVAPEGETSENNDLGMDEDDDIFNNINLEEIESSYKKRKIDFN